MLQQTTVASVVPYYRAFLERFPDWGSLARAREDEVLAAWSGLGYYARARNLRLAARQIMARHAGSFPRDAAAARALRGFGDYTASAVLSIAFGLPEPALDANARRVLVRLTAESGPLARAAVRGRLRAAAVRLIPPSAASDFNQALMELGALVCLPRAPRCGACPVAPDCAARRLGLEGTIPAPAPRRAPVKVSGACAVVWHGSRFLLARGQAQGGVKALWEVPSTLASGSARRPNARDAAAGSPAECRAFRRRLRAHLVRDRGLRVSPLRKVGILRHAITHRRFRMLVFTARCVLPPRPRRTDRTALRWVSPDGLPRIPSGGIARKALTLALGLPSPRPVVPRRAARGEVDGATPPG